MNLVTGGTGLVGSHLILKLAMQGENIRALYRAKSNKSDIEKLFSFNNSSHLYRNIEWIECDLLDSSAIGKALKGVKRVYHCAAKVSFSPKHKAEMFSVNVEATSSLVDASITNKIESFCFVSSTASLGKSVDNNAICETDFFQRDGDHPNYSLTKFLAEMEVWRGMQEGLNAFIVNPSVIIGAGSKNRSSGEIIQMVAKGMPFYTAGSTGFVYVGDVVDTMIKLSEKKVRNERFIINGENLSYKEFLYTAAKLLNVKPPRVQVGKFLTGLGWRIEKLRHYLTGKEPTLTKSTARISHKKECYSSQKLIDFLGIELTPIEVALKEATAFFKV